MGVLLENPAPRTLPGDTESNGGIQCEISAKVTLIAFAFASSKLCRTRSINFDIGGGGWHADDQAFTA